MNVATSFESYAQRILRFGTTKPQQAACVFQTRGPETAATLSYGQLRERVLQRAALFASKGYANKRAALIFATGIDFVVDFLACLHAGVVAVPLNLSRNPQQFSRTLAVLANADITAILTTDDVVAYVKSAVSDARLELGAIDWLTESTPLESGIALAEIAQDDIAFIQYTSGSTSDPKGVVVSQANIVHNQEAIRRACAHRDGLIAGGWLPQFHDMGLIGHMLQPLYMGGTYVFMPPMNFIQRPRRWLELISHYRIQSSAAPNFGYEHCLKCILAKEDLSGLDLSCWTVALNGSEPVNAETMARFAERFKPYGFQAQAFFPCYGMAETTLFVSGGPVGLGAGHQVLDASAFERGEIKPAPEGKIAVSCGRVSSDFDLKIVNPQTMIECPPGIIGEIWLAGSSVAQGYWRRPTSTQETFQAEIANAPGKGYLRTGDMGYRDGDDLYVTGRIKEMVILRGRNIYPYDIERTCNQHKHASGTSAVFASDVDGHEALNIIVEIKKSVIASVDLQALESDILGTVSQRHQVLANRVVLVKPGTIPKTTSGKIQRTKCRELLTALNQAKVECM